MQNTLKVGTDVWVRAPQTGVIADAAREQGKPLFTTRAGGDDWNKPVRILSLDHQKGLAIFEGIPLRCKRKKRGVIKMEYLSNG